MLVYMIEPRYCRPEAFQQFLEALEQLHTTQGLLRAAIAISAHALDDIVPARVEARLAALSAEVNARVRSVSPDARLAHLHEVLFQQEGFQGNFQHYYSALNSYLPAVLDSKRGLPITLSLIYKVVGEAAGLAIEGVNAPEHFLARVFVGGKTLVVDPFFAGECLTELEAWQRLEHVLGERLQQAYPGFPAATHDQWIARMILNLQVIFKQEGRTTDLAAMGELQRALLLWRYGQEPK